MEILDMMVLIILSLTVPIIISDRAIIERKWTALTFRKQIPDDVKQDRDDGSEGARSGDGPRHVKDFLRPPEYRGPYEVFKEYVKIGELPESRNDQERVR